MEKDDLRNKEEEKIRQTYINSNIGGIRFLPPDVFFSPKDKRFIDRLSLDMLRIRGQNIYYWPKLDTPTRTDDVTNGSTKPDLSPFSPKGREGGGIYGESVIVGNRFDSVTREVTQAWGYGDPFQFRGIPLNPVTSQEPNERGYIETHKLTFEVSRLMCEEKGFSPKSGDVIELSEFLLGYYDVELVKTDTSKWGGNGFFDFYQLSLKKNSSFVPQRKNLTREQI